MSADFPLPIGEPPQEHAAHPAWAVDLAQPTDLLVFWPDAHAPTQVQVIAALQDHIIGEDTLQVLDEFRSSDADDLKAGSILWKAAIQLPASADHFAMPIIVWAEPARPLPAETAATLKSEHVKWVIGFETLLWPADPASHLIDLLRLLGNAFPSSPAIFDVNKEGWHVRKELDDVIVPATSVVSESILWFVHAVSADTTPNENSRYWLYTMGLERCGLPELEMLDVPHPLVGAAMMLLNTVGELIVEGGIPDPGQPLEVGDQITIALQPWREAAQYIDENLLGHPNNRVAHGNFELNGVRAAVCASEPAGSYRKIWTWPEAAVTRLAAHGETAVHRTQWSQQRQAQIARSTWCELTAAYATLPAMLRQPGDQRQAVFLVKAGFQTPRAANGRDDIPQREYLWLEVDRFAGSSRVKGHLVNEPQWIPHLQQTSKVEVDLAFVCDWHVITRNGMFGPNTAEGLRDAMRVIAESKHA